MQWVIEIYAVIYCFWVGTFVKINCNWKYNQHFTARKNKQFFLLLLQNPIDQIREISLRIQLTLCNLLSFFFTWNPSKFLDDEFNESGVIGEYGKPGGVDSICVLNIVGIPKMSEVGIASPETKFKIFINVTQLHVFTINVGGHFESRTHLYRK